MTKNIANTSWGPFAATGTGGTYNSWEPTGAGWLLPSTQTSIARESLASVNPMGSEGVNSRYLFASSYFSYSVPIVVRGGRPPYHFTITSAPVGSTIVERTPEDNPLLVLWADFKMPANTGGTYTVKCTDQDSNAVSVTVVVAVDDSHFIYVSTTGSDASATPSDPATPLLTQDGWYKSLEADSTYSDKTVVNRAGTYVLDNFDPANTVLDMTTDKPSSHIEWPSETAIFDTDVNWTFRNGVNDIFTEVSFLGGDAVTNDTRVLQITGAQARVVVREPLFDTPPSGALGTDNNSCFYMSSSGGMEAHTYVALVNPSYSNLPHSTNGMSMWDWYSTADSIVIGGRGTDVLSRYGGWFKGRNTRVSAIGCDLYDSTNEADNGLKPQNDNGGVSAITHYAYCKVFTSTSEKAVALGDSNSAWGTAYIDRCSLYGHVVEEGGDTDLNGDATVNQCIIVSDETPILATWITDSDNALYAVGSNPFDAHGDVVNGDLGLRGYKVTAS